MDQPPLPPPPHLSQPHTCCHSAHLAFRPVRADHAHWERKWGWEHLTSPRMSDSLRVTEPSFTFSPTLQNHSSMLDRDINNTWCRLHSVACLCRMNAQDKELYNPTNDPSRTLYGRSSCRWSCVCRAVFASSPFLNISHDSRVGSKCTRA